MILIGTLTISHFLNAIMGCGMSQYKGKPRTLGDPSPPKPNPSAQPLRANNPVQAEPSPETEPEGPLPGPENRSLKVSIRKGGVAAAPSPAVDDSEYALRGSDVKGMSVGAKAKPKTFADAKGGARQQPLIANVKFNIDLHSEAVTVEAKFQTRETLSALHEFLRVHVLNDGDEYELRQPFPSSLIPNDQRTLASQKISGSVMLNVMIKGKPGHLKKLKH
jgi:hypothetical protein